MSSKTTSKTKILKKVKDQTSKLNLTTEELHKAKEIATSIDHTNPESVMNFGIDTQKKLGRYSNELLQKIKIKDAGDTGDVINSLMHELNYIDVEGIDKSSILSKLPVVGHFFDKVKQTLSKYETVEENIDDIVNQLDKSRSSLLRDSATLSNLFEKNVSYIEEMNINIQAGYMKIEEIWDEILPQLDAEYKKNPDDSLLFQEIQDVTEYANNLERKLVDLQSANTLGKQSLPQIRMIQNGNTNMVEKIQSAVMVTIPLWKNQITLAVSLNKQQKILEASKQVTETTNKLLMGNASLLKTNTVEVAKQNEETIIDIKTIKNTNKMLIETMNDIQKIKEDGRKKREVVKKELQKAETELTDKILDFKTNIQEDAKKKETEFQQFQTDNGIEFEIPSMVDDKAATPETVSIKED